MNNLAAILFPMILITGLIGGCGQPDSYDVCVLNKTDGSVDDVTVTGAGGPIHMGTIIKGSGKSYSSFPGRPPDAMKVSWKSIDNKKQSIQVSLVGVVPTQFRGTIYLKIRSNEEVQAAAYEEKDVAGAVKYETAP